MIKEIKYNGHSASPSDYQSLDGDMASMLNCIPERGALKPILPPETVESFVDKRVLAIHKISDFEVYILDDYDEDILYWRKVDKKEDGYTLLHDFTEAGVKSVTPIGNTLAVLDGNGTIHYFLWKDSTYTYLGTQLPELDAKPYIASRIYDIQTIRDTFGDDYSDKDFNLDDYKISGDEMLDAQDLYQITTTVQGIELKGGKRQKIYEKVFAHLNLINKLLQQKGAVTAPLYVRFAYRLYDGSHTGHTVPVLIVPTTLGAPLLSCDLHSHHAVVDTAYFSPLYTASYLTADIHIPAELAHWGDIVSHIDVFITPQLTDYSDSAESLQAISRAPYYWGFEFVYSKAPQLMDNGKHWASVLEKYDAEKKTEDYYAPYIITELTEGKKISSKHGKEKALLCISHEHVDAFLTDSKGETTYFSDISQGPNIPGIPSEYALYTSINPDEIYTYHGSKTNAAIYLNTVRSSDLWPVTQGYYIKLRRTDNKDYADVLTDYSNFYKLCEFDIKKYKNGFTGAIPVKKDVLVSLATRETLPDTGQGRSQNIVSHLFSYNNRLNTIIKGEILPTCASLPTQNPAAGSIGTYRLEYAYVKVVENSQTSYYRLPDEQTRTLDLKIVYFAYPKSTATELEVFYSDSQGNPYVRTIPLMRHPFLNLAYAFNMFDEIEGELRDTGFIERPQTPILYGNKIKTSDVNNPFIFSEENTSELPVGEIFALSTAAKALSQGQFGQFPLYAFTDKGVWALEVTGTGTYSARQPITRDVVLNPESVTQIDDAVLFATQRGIMLLSGSQVQCISEVLDGEAFDWEQYGFAYKKTGELGLPTFVVPWEQYKANIQMLYDYTGQRIIVFNPVFNPLYPHAYVFSLESKQWGIMESNIKSTVNYYPRAYAMTRTGDLVDYSAADKDFAEGYYITRPLKLDAPDVHKTITGIIQRGQFKKGHVNTMLYGSRDLDKWYPVYGSNDHILRGMRGTPYKYFRIASTFRLDKDESITGCSIDFEPRLNNKLR